MRRAGFESTALGLALAVLPASSARAETFHAFNPTPRAQMRDLSTDRPDTTESPRTVDAGHVQIELDAIVLVDDRRDGVRTTGYELMPTNLKLGLLDRVDLQVVVEPWHRVSTKAAGERAEIDEGYGATTVRLKTNLWGNDSGPTAFALMPFVTWVDDGADFGLIAPLGIELPAELSAGLMLEADVVRREDGARAVELVPTATLSRDVVGPLGAFVEIAGTVPLDGDEGRLSGNGGLTVGVTDDVQLDTGLRAGLSGPVPDLEVFAGAALRF